MIVGIRNPNITHRAPVRVGSNLVPKFVEIGILVGRRVRDQVPDKFERYVDLYIISSFGVIHFHLVSDAHLCTVLYML